MEPSKYYRMRDLRFAFKRAGLFQGNNVVYFTTKIRRLEKAGRLKLPRNGGGQRQFTLEQIADVVAAFLPSGPGCYYYKKPSMTQIELRAIKDAVIQNSITKKIKEMEGENATDKYSGVDTGEVSVADRQQQITERVSTLRKKGRVRV